MADQAIARTGVKGKTATAAATPMIGKASTAVDVATNPNPTSAVAEAKMDDPTVKAFALAREIAELLKGSSNKTTFEALQMVASLNGLRVISADRPIGQSVMGKQRPLARQQPLTRQKGQQPRAAYKQTKEYLGLQESRSKVVATIKKLEDGSEKASAISDLRAVEQKLKALRASKQGN
jgi:hypothetical protein